MHASVGLLLALAASANAYVAPGAMPLTGARSVSRPPRHALWRCRTITCCYRPRVHASQPQSSQAGNGPAPLWATMARRRAAASTPMLGRAAWRAARPERRTGRRRFI